MATCILRPIHQAATPKTAKPARSEQAASQEISEVALSAATPPVNSAYPKAKTLLAA